jgi:cyclohexanone monooxygenase
MIRFGTGFDAFTRTLTRIDIRGVDGQSLRVEWVDGRRSYLNMALRVPKLLHRGVARLLQQPSLRQFTVKRITNCIAHLEKNGQTKIRAVTEAEEWWNEHGAEFGKELIYEEADSWLNGGKIPGKKRTFLLYPGSALGLPRAHLVRG